MKTLFFLTTVLVLGAVVFVFLATTASGDDPVAIDDEYSVDEDGSLVVTADLGVLANDADVDLDVLTATLVVGPTTGSLVLTADGSFSYTPDPHFNGQDAFTYTANDGTGDSNVATVTITVISVNDLPVATADAYQLLEDSTLIVTAGSGVLANDTDVDLDC